MSTTPHVYTAITEVMAKLTKDGISKARKNTQQGYSFRGIDDVYNALAPFLSESKLLILPRVLSRQVTERVTQKGGVLFYVVLDVEFDLVSAIDGSKHTVKVSGEAMDSGDKATNKAMSAAYKYACMEVFCIPTEGDNDADSTTHEIVPEKRGLDPRGDHPPVNREMLEEYCARIADVMAHEGETRALKLYDLHLELVNDQGFYIALSDELATRDIVGKDGFKKLVKEGRRIKEKQTEKAAA